MFVAIWILVLFVVFCIVQAVFGIVFLCVLMRRIDAPTLSTPPPFVPLDIKSLEDAVRVLPSKVLQSIQSSTNTHKGALGELIGYIELRASYDRIIPLGNIVDFVCVRFPTEDDEGCIDFIDVKTGAYSRLSKDQRLLQKLIQEKRINFKKLKVQTTSNDNENISR